MTKKRNTATLSPQMHTAMQRSAFFVVLYTSDWLTDPAVQAQAAYAAQLGKPFRVLVIDDSRVPEDAFCGVTDLEIARVHGPAEAGRQVERWLKVWHERQA